MSHLNTVESGTCDSVQSFPGSRSFSQHSADCYFTTLLGTLKLTIVGTRRSQSRRRLHEPLMCNRLETWDGHLYQIYNSCGIPAGTLRRHANTAYEYITDAERSVSRISFLSRTKSLSPYPPLMEGARLDTGPLNQYTPLYTGQ